MQAIRIAIADDHPIVIEGIHKLLMQQKQFNVTATYNSGAELLKGLKNDQPDILLLDINFPDTTGNELARIISKDYPALRILVITSVENTYDIRDMIKNGCSGYILKSAPIDMLSEAIETIHKGEQFLAPELKEQLLESMLNPSSKTKPESMKLTQREHILLELLAEGKTNNEIAAELFLSHRTIENNRLSLYQKLGVKNTAALIRVAMQRGLIE